jgi:hypothetical protein
MKHYIFVILGVFLTLTLFASLHSLQAFEISAYHDAVSIVRSANWDGYGLCDKDTVKIAGLQNNDQILQWWEEMGITNLYVVYDSVDFCRLNGHSLQVMNHRWPKQKSEKIS